MRQPPTKKTFNFFDRITVGDEDFLNNMISWPFISCGIILLNEGSSGNIVQYSFDGQNVHGDMDPDTASAALAFDSRHQDKIYFRLSAGTSATVRIEVWA